jgi:hypothetical protein
MSANIRATMAKRQRELDQKDRAKDRESRRADRKARQLDRAARGEVGVPIEALPPPSPDEAAPAGEPQANTSDDAGPPVPTPAPT